MVVLVVHQVLAITTIQALVDLVRVITIIITIIQDLAQDLAQDQAQDLAQDLIQDPALGQAQDQAQDLTQDPVIQAQIQIQAKTKHRLRQIKILILRMEIIIQEPATVTPPPKIITVLGHLVIASHTKARQLLQSQKKFALGIHHI